MDPSIFYDTLYKVHLSPRTFAHMLGRKYGQIRHWYKGQQEIPEDVADWLKKFEYFMDQNPPPQK